jgi:hypothetical protein
MTIKNALIKSASLEIEDHNILTAWLHLDYGHSGQGFGGYSLGLGSDYKHRDDAKEHLFCQRYLRRCMEVAGVTKWSDLPGKTIRVKSDGEFGPILAIGHIVKDDWFAPKDEALKIFPEG